jgi:ABC-type uncharacterized transport system ATPase subunit
MEWPKLLILDEPTMALTPREMTNSAPYKKTAYEEGMGVFISSHILSSFNYLRIPLLL